MNSADSGKSYQHLQLLYGCHFELLSYYQFTKYALSEDGAVNIPTTEFMPLGIRVYKYQDTRY